MVTAFASNAWFEAEKSFLRHLRAVRARKTALFYESRLNVLCRWATAQNIPIDRFGKRNLDDYLAERSESNISRTTLHHDARAAKVFFKWAVKYDVITRNPLADFELHTAPTPPKYMPTDEDMRSLLQALRGFWDPEDNPDSRFVPAGKRNFHSDKNYAIILTLVDSACRIEEVLSLKLDDFQKDQLHIRHSKGKEQRSVPVSPECQSALRDWLKVRTRIMNDVPDGEDEGWLFISEAGTKIPGDRFNKVLHRITAYAGLSKQITLHSLRRYSLNRLSKHNLLMAQTIAGHKDPRTTLIYTKIDPEFVRSMHDEVGVVRSILTSKRAEKRKRLSFANR
jgi:site-specific recombinase XerD